MNKIIGYKAPFDMFDGDIKKDTLYKPLASNNNKYYAAVDDDGHAIDGGKTNLPKEIVELWIPEYAPNYNIGDIVVSLKDVGSLRRVGEIFTVLNITDRGSVYYKPNAYGSSDEFRLATQEEVKQHRLDLLIEEAKKRYPVGTRFIGAHVPDQNHAISIVTNTEFKTGSTQSAGLTLTAMTDEGTYYSGKSKYGNTANDRIVYIDGRWAEIITIPEIRINGYSGLFLDDGVVFGCAKIAKEVFISLDELNRLKLHPSNREIEEVTIGKGSFTKDQIAEIAAYYNNIK